MLNLHYNENSILTGEHLINTSENLIEIQVTTPLKHGITLKHSVYIIYIYPPVIEGSYGKWLSKR